MTGIELIQQEGQRFRYYANRLLLLLRRFRLTFAVISLYRFKDSSLPLTDKDYPVHLPLILTVSKTCRVVGRKPLTFPALCEYYTIRYIYVSSKADEMASLV